MKSIKLFSVFVVLLFAQKPFAKIATYGYLPSGQIKVGQTRFDVKKTAGEPTFIDGQNWYYTEIKIRQNRLGLGKRYSSETIKIAFDKNDKVKTTQKFLVKNQKPPKVAKKSDLFNANKKTIQERLKEIFGSVAPSF